MKFKITLQDPDGVYDSLTDAVNDSMQGIYLEDDELESVAQLRREKFNKLIERWFRWGESVTIEIDTDEHTARVVENQS